MANGLNDVAMVLAANALRAAMTKMRLHAGDPGAAGTSNPTTSTVQSVTWSAATSNGDFGLSAAVNFTGVAANGATQWVSLWDTANTTWYGNFQLTGDQTANAAGEYSVTALNLNGSAT
jgi:hypothetical protein